MKPDWDRHLTHHLKGYHVANCQQEGYFRRSAPKTWRTLYAKRDYCNERRNAETPLHNVYQLFLPPTVPDEKRSCLTRCSASEKKDRGAGNGWDVWPTLILASKTVFLLPRRAHGFRGERPIFATKKPGNCCSLLAHRQNRNTEGRTRFDSSPHYTTKIQRNYVNTFSSCFTRMATFGTTGGSSQSRQARIPHF